MVVPSQTILLWLGGGDCHFRLVFHQYRVRSKIGVGEGASETSELRFELEAVSIEVRPLLDKSICRAEAVAARKCWPNGGVLKRSITFCSMQ